MNNFNALDILKACINELNSTTKEEFDNKRKKLGIYDKIYNPKEYMNDEVQIVFNLDENINGLQNDLIWAYESEFTNLSLVQDDEYNICNQNSSIDMEANYITNININCEQPNIAALAA